MYLLNKYLLTILALLFLFSCANIVTPQGGPKDTTPPIITNTEPADSTLNFSSKKIVVHFNENILLPNGAQGFTISPLLKTPLLAETSGKQLTITFKDLKPNTTYIVKGENAITDNTEFNKYPLFEYVFSTGNHLDTGIVTGYVYQSENNKPAPGIIVGIQPIKNIQNYNTLQTLQPEYYTKTDTKGYYKINGVAADTYYLYCFNDENKNMLYENGESIGFSRFHVITGDTLLKNLHIYNTKKTIQNGIISQTVIQNGYYHIEFEPNNSITSINQTDVSNDKRSSLYYCLNDSCSANNSFDIFTSTQLKDSAHFVASSSTGNIPFAFPVSKIPSKVTVTKASTTLKRETLIYFNRPIDTGASATQKIIITQYKDTVKAIYHFLNPFTLLIELTEPGYYTLKIPSQSIHDIFGNYLDSGMYPIQIFSESQLSSIIFKPHTHESNNILQVTGSGFCQKYLLTDSNQVSLNNLIPGKYIITVFTDSNQNSFRDDGDLLLQIFPEKVVYFKELDIKPSIEYEEELYLYE